MKHTENTPIRIILVVAIVYLLSLTSRAGGVTSQNASFDNKMAHIYSLASSGKNRQALRQAESFYRNSKKAKSKRLDEINLLRGRILFAMQEYGAAMQAYDLIDKKSKFWLPSVEERAWTKVYLGKVNEAIADSHTLMSPLFQDVASPEAFFLTAFVSHQVCDFTRVFKTVDDFKKISRDKIKSLEALSSDKKSSIDLAHYSDVIKRLQLIEADAIQRLYMDKNLKGKRMQVSAPSKPGAYDLQFPYEKDDVWIDEIDQLKVDAKRCPTLLKQVVSL